MLGVSMWCSRALKEPDFWKLHKTKENREHPFHWLLYSLTWLPQLPMNPVRTSFTSFHWLLYSFTCQSDSIFMYWEVMGISTFFWLKWWIIINFEETDALILKLNIPGLAITCVIGKIALGSIIIDISRRPFMGEREQKQSSFTSEILPCHQILHNNQNVSWVIKRLPNCCIIFIQQHEVAHVS